MSRRLSGRLSGVTAATIETEAGALTRSLMSEPTADELFRAITALIPFVRRWELPLNPEDAEELAYAVLFHARSNQSAEEIGVAVELQIDQHEKEAQRLNQAMKAAQGRRSSQE
jgi:hypothetical protein